jgi:formylmethanofuran dehydrogenase subunit C
MIVLTLKEPPSLALEAEVLSPDVLAPLTNEEIRSLPLFLGRKQVPVGDVFTVEGAGGDRVEIRGDASKVKWIGRGMTRGCLTITGDTGMHLGAFMTGGSIEVTGSVSDWLGAEMSGGLIRVHGDAGDHVGAAYRGGLTGMRDGTILVEGSAGLEVGRRMKRGTIAVGGTVRELAGLQMKGGTILVRRGADLRAGALMVRGTIVSLAPISILPTFAYASTCTPTFLRVYARHLATLGFDVPCDEQVGTYRRYVGDSSVPGKGEILVYQPSATGDPGRSVRDEVAVPDGGGATDD